MGPDPILVVDDEQSIRSTMTAALAPLERDVVTAVNGEHALEELAARRFALVFLDLKMPGIGGMAVLRNARASWPELPIVVITAHGTIAAAVEAMKLGAADFVQKPFGPDEIREVAERSLGLQPASDAPPASYSGLVAAARRDIEAGKLVQALAAARRAIAADPSRPEAYNLLGAVLERRQHWLEAQRFYRTALEMSPTYAPAQANLDRVTSWEKLGRIELGRDASEPAEDEEASRDAT